MAKTKKKVSRVKTKKKTWFKVVAPKLFGSKEIGETYLSAIDKAVGRVLTVNLRELSGNVKDQNTYIGFRITKADGSTLQTATIGYKLASTFVKRLVRKNTTRMDDYFNLKTKDGKSVILKTLMIARYRTQRSVRTSLRKQIGEFLQAELDKGNFESFVSNLVTYKVQGSLKRKLSKTYPLKEATVRVMILQDKNGSATVAPLIEETELAEDVPEDSTEETEKVE